MHVELYVELSDLMQTIGHMGGVAHQMMSPELLANLVRGADRDLGLNGDLIRHMQAGQVNVQTVQQMDDEQWNSFLYQRMGHTHWERWHAKNSGNRYSIVVSHQLAASQASTVQPEVPFVPHEWLGFDRSKSSRERSDDLAKKQKQAYMNDRMMTVAIYGILAVFIALPVLGAVLYGLLGFLGGLLAGFVAAFAWGILCSWVKGTLYLPACKCDPGKRAAYEHVTPLLAFHSEPLDFRKCKNCGRNYIQVGGVFTELDLQFHTTPYKKWVLFRGWSDDKT